jgi:hypothetical protein
MYWIGLALLFLIFMAVYLVRHYLRHDYWIDGSEIWGKLGTRAFFSVVIWLLVALILSLSVPQEGKFRFSRPIVTLKDTNGQYYIRYMQTGSDSNLYYRYLYPYNDGLRAGNINADYGVFIEGNTAKPHIDFYKPVYKMKVLNYLFPLYGYADKYIYIPKGSIVKDEYKVDLQ